MKKRLLYGLGVALLAVCVTLIVWQGSFSFGEYGPSSPDQTFLFWAVSTLVFVLAVTLGFMLFRTGVKLYIERRSGREGSRIKTKLVVGALALSFLPVCFLVLWGVSVLNRNLEKWFSRPAENVRLNLAGIGAALARETRDRAHAEARWLAALAETQSYAAGGGRPLGFFEKICRDNGYRSAWIERAGGARLTVCPAAPADPRRPSVTARLQLGGQAALLLEIAAPLDIALEEAEIARHIREYDQLSIRRKETRTAYILLLLAVSLFILFAATWIAQFLARQISEPISALLDAAGRVRRGDLSARVSVRAIDELASLVRAFNEMTQELEGNSRELERRRRFTEAILESIPTGVISLAADGSIQRVNPALARILPEERVAQATRLEDLFTREDTAEIRYLCKRARRTGLASRQLELTHDRRTLHLAITASALEDKLNSGFVLVLEDTSELLRAQRLAAWHEVARRVAHEIKNPLTPIALCAERIGRQLDKLGPAGEPARIMRECSATISTEVESVRTLVDEFSQLARFPAANPAPSDLSEVVEGALGVFAGRLDGVEILKDLAPDLPPVNLDREQFKRVVVNLVDNAAEAMQDSLVKRLFVGTQAPTPDTVELIVADTGSGVSPEDREKLFLPYFSTKGRGTGLGLAIVAHILADHRAQIRVEDNIPAGARFIVEIPAFEPAEVEARANAT
jgi:PAS domain S-box-containing protein